MSNDDKAPDPFGLSQADPSQADPSQAEPTPAGDPAPSGQDPNGAYAALDAASQGVKVEQPSSGYDDIFGDQVTMPPRPPSDPAPTPRAPGDAPDLTAGSVASGFPPPGEGAGPPGPPRASSASRPSGVQPLSAKSSGGSGKLLAFVAVVVIGGGLAFFFVSSQEPERGPAPVAEEKPDDDAPEIDLAKVLAERPPNAPNCWETDDGYRFVYKDASGQTVTKDKITEVPTLYRASAACKRP